MKESSKSDNTRRFIVEATSSVFNKKGYAGTALSDLTEATSLSKGSIYGNFENKEAVALAVFDYNLSIVQQLIRTKVNQFSTYKEKLLAHVQVYHSFEQTPFPDGGCPLMNTATEADDTNERLRERASQGLKGWRDSLIRLVEKGIVAEEFKANTDSNIIAVTMVALIEGGMMMCKVTRDPMILDDTVIALKELIERISV